MLRAEEFRAGDQGESVAWSSAQRAAIQAEAGDILAHPSFKNSKRCVTLLRRLIEYALKGDHEGVKERTLGIEVFGRDADYDTNADPIVRMTANEIRKRLAQYYQESTKHHEVKIRLVPGAYLPHFDFDAAEGSEEEAVAEGEHELVPFPVPVEVHPNANPEPRRIFSWRSWIPWAAAATLVVAAVLVSHHLNLFSSTQELMWAPLLEENEPVTVCVADTNTQMAHTDMWAQEIAAIISTRKIPQWTENPLGMPAVPFVDTKVATMTSAWLSVRHKATIVRQTPTVTLDDLRRGPAVLVGAFDNVWSMVLLSDLRYSVRVDPVTQEEWIGDAQNPARRDWKGSGKLLYSDNSVDYAIVTRILAPETGKWILAAGGLGMHGTEAAGELVTDPAFAGTLPAALRSTRKNFQIVLKTTVIDGHTGPPQIVAVHTW